MSFFDIFQEFFPPEQKYDFVKNMIFPRKMLKKENFTFFEKLFSQPITPRQKCLIWESKANDVGGGSFNNPSKHVHYLNKFKVTFVKVKINFPP